MMAPMNDLLQFLRARLDEEAADARAAASKRGGGTWEAVLGDDFRSSVCGRYHEGELGYPSRPVIIDPDDHETSVHIARHDPARVLREVEAKRRTMELHGIVHRDIMWLESGAETTAELPVCGLCVPRHSAYRDRDDVPEGPCATLRLLALPYADHHDYRPQWQP